MDLDDWRVAGNIEKTYVTLGGGGFGLRRRKTTLKHAKEKHGVVGPNHVLEKLGTVMSFCNETRKVLREPAWHMLYCDMKRC
jgi:hypothetical protein